MHAGRVVGWSAAAAVVSALTLGCASQDAAPRGVGFGGDAPAREGPRLQYGAVDPRYRRAADDAAESPFLPVALPAANDVRLGSGAPGPAYWQQRVDYDMNVRVDTEKDSLSGDMRVTYHNNSPHRLEYLWVQLEQNLFKPDSLGARSFSPGGVLTERPDFPGGYTIASMRSGGQELAYSVHDTLMRVELPRPIEPGATFEYELAWSFPVPPYLRRMGMEKVEAGKIFEFAQWFPHVCKYDDVSGWNTLQYLGNGEFYTDFGRYTLNITVPSEYVVIATGELQNAPEVLTESELSAFRDAKNHEEPIYVIPPEAAGKRAVPAGQTRTWRYTADNVRTVAFAASDAFIWDACGADVTEKTGAKRRVLCQSIYPVEAHTQREGVWSPEHEGEPGPAGSTRYVKHAIEYYSDWLYPYPYPVMTNVNGPEGGMEYPMMVFCGARKNERGLFGVTDHEVGHNWFPMLVNSDERRYFWQDEGFNSFINIYSEAAWYKESPNPDNDIRRTLVVMNADNRQPPIVAPDYQWAGWRGPLNYSKIAVGMFLLREVVMGPERFDAAFRGYVDRWAFKSPQPADFLRCMEDGAGIDLGWWWRGWILGSGVVDFSVVSASLADDNRSGYVEIACLGEVVYPVPYRVTFEDGSTKDFTMPVEAWASTDRWRNIIDAGGKRITGVQLDPLGYFPDVDLDNNVWGRPVLSGR